MNAAEFLHQWKSLSPEAMAMRASQTLPFWVSLLLVLAIGYYAARAIWLLVPTDKAPAWTPPPFSATPEAGPAADTAAYAAISNAHLFGQANADGEPTLDNAAEAPETQLNLQLRGVVAALDQRFAHAIIADSGGTEKVYFLKDPVPGGAVLQQVQNDRVILSRGGVIEALLLPQLSQGASAGLNQRPAFQPQARRVSTPSMQDVVAQNAGGIMEIIRPQPFMPNGELKGYRIYPGRNRDQFVALGLQPGDLVTEINGMTLNNPSQAMELFRSLSNTTSLTVTLERQGQSQTLTLDTTQVASAGSPAAEGGPAAKDEHTEAPD